MYLPKTKYKGNLYTAGTEYVLPGEINPYVGPYFETFTGETYTGTSPSKNSKKLLPFEEQGSSRGIFTEGPPPVMSEQYDGIRENQQEFKLRSTLDIPVYYPKPMPVDYRKRFIVRYFAIEKTTTRILEISKEVYTSLNSKEPKYYYPKYDTKAIQWSLVNVRANQDTLQVSRLSSYLKDPSQFVR
jgi:hypothetical protein